MQKGSNMSTEIFDAERGVRDHIEKICAEAMLGEMVPIYEIILIRDVPEEVVLALSAEDVEFDFMEHIVHGVNEIEAELKECVDESGRVRPRRPWRSRPSSQ